ncbi:MAG: hypothetical protein ACK56W_01435 [Pirellula sp.]|jgi:hypothetical protein|nr:hypothetical protein [Pirellula sp.]
MTEPTKFYRKPGQPFRCGLTNAGRPCLHGPIGGSCGQSDKDQEKCYPARTLAGWTRIVSSIGTLGAIAILLIVVPSTRLQTAIAPGALSNPHAQLLNSNGAEGDPHLTMTINSDNRCKACHPSSNDTNAESAKIPGQLITAKVGAQSQLCMNCHQQSMPNGFDGSPHDLVGESLLALQRTSATASRPRLANRVTECSQCHREHRGSGENLQAITSERCQSCHSRQFQSFSHGHPEFQNYPQAKLRSIAFDHGRHKDLHFQKNDTTFDCRTCHVNTSETGAIGSVFRSVSYEQACAQCHDQPLRSAISEGLVVLQVPSLDRSKLKLAGFELGEWPESASQLMDGSLSPLLMELLRRQPEGTDILAKLPASGKLRDVNLSDREQAKTVVKLAETVRVILDQLASNGQPFLRNSLEQQLSEISIQPTTTQKLVSANTVGLNSSQMASVKLDAPRHSMMSNWLNNFSSGFSPDLVRTARERWFRARENSKPQNRPPLADTFVRQPSSIVVSTRSQSQSDDLLASPSQLSKGTSGDSDLLGGDLLGSESLLTTPADRGPDSSQPNVGKDKPIKPWDHLPYGGWMLDESRVAIVYVPQGHGDPWLSRWIEWQKLSSDSPNGSVGELTTAQQCIQCHTVSGDRVRGMLQEDGNQSATARFVSLGRNNDFKVSEQINSCWKISQRPSAERTITKFSHTPHLTIPALSDCKSCHVLHSQNSSAAGTHGWSQSGMILHHEFQSMLLQNCSKCHTKESAGDNCTQCHNYHVNTYQEDALPLGAASKLPIQP